MAKSKSDQGADVDQVKARVIFAGEFGAMNDVVLVDKGTEHPDLDLDPGAVAYAETLAAK